MNHIRFIGFKNFPDRLLADQADTPTLRERLLDLARIWKQAAIDEEALMNRHGVGVMTNRNPPYNGFRQGS